MRGRIRVSFENDLSQSVIVLLAHHERAVARQYDVDGPIELGGRCGTILLPGCPIAGDRGDVAGWADRANTMVVAVGDVDGSPRGNDEPSGVVEAGFGRLAVGKSTLSIAGNSGDRPVGIDPTDGMIVLVRHIQAPIGVRLHVVGLVELGFVAYAIGKARAAVA